MSYITRLHNAGKLGEGRYRETDGALLLNEADVAAFEESRRKKRLSPREQRELERKRRENDERDVRARAKRKKREAERREHMCRQTSALETLAAWAERQP